VEAMIPDIFKQFGVSGMLCVILYLVIRSSTEQRKEKRDAEIEVLTNKVDANKESLTKHINHHQDFEKNVCHKIDRINDRLNPLCNDVSRILGYMEGKKNDKGL